MQASVLSRQFVVIVDRAQHRWAGVAQPVIPDDLAVVFDELLDVQRAELVATGDDLTKRSISVSKLKPRMSKVGSGGESHAQPI